MFICTIYCIFTFRFVSNLTNHNCAVSDIAIVINEMLKSVVKCHATFTLLLRAQSRLALFVLSMFANVRAISSKFFDWSLRPWRGRRKNEGKTKKR